MSPYTTPIEPIARVQKPVRGCASAVSGSAAWAPLPAVVLWLMGWGCRERFCAVQNNQTARIYRRAGARDSSEFRGSGKRAMRIPPQSLPVYGNDIKYLLNLSPFRSRGMDVLNGHLGTDLDHPAGRNLEEVGGVAGRPRQPDEQ